MTFTVRQAITQVSINCGGLCRMPARGAGVISGTTKNAGTLAACRVYLFDADSMLVGYRESDPTTGVYSFVGLPPGEYILMVLDANTPSYRGKLEHVVVT